MSKLHRNCKCRKTKNGDVSPVGSIGVFQVYQTVFVFPVNKKRIGLGAAQTFFEDDFYGFHHPKKWHFNTKSIDFEEVEWLSALRFSVGGPSTRAAM